MKICVIGQGYIGLPTAALFADSGCEVIGVDINEKIINLLNNNQIPIEEPELDKIIGNALKRGNLKFQLTPDNADVFIITVPTPYLKENYSCDLSYVISACDSILPYIQKNCVIIIESTISPLSMDEIIKPIFEKENFMIGQDLFLAHCPERVLPGHILYELVNNNRIVGGITPKCSEKAAEVYSLFVKGEIIMTEARTAELSKCMENTFRDVNIALVNELVQICSKIGVNALDVIKLANMHPRVNLHNPGPGVGGHCLAIDPYFIYSKAPDLAKIIKTSRDTNSNMPYFVVDSVKKIFHKFNNVGKISIFGVAYKGNTDDDRESPSYDIIYKLKEEYDISIYDPHINKEKFSELYDSVKNSDLILILTDHDEFKTLNYDDLLKEMNTPIIFDTKNIILADNISDDFILINFGNLYEFIN